MAVTRLNVRMAPTKNGKEPIVYLGTHPTDRKWQKAFAENIGNDTGKCMEKHDEEDAENIQEVWEWAKACTPSKGEKSWDPDDYE